MFHNLIFSFRLRSCLEVYSKKSSEENEDAVKAKLNDEEERKVGYEKIRSEKPSHSTWLT